MSCADAAETRWGRWLVPAVVLLSVVYWAGLARVSSPLVVFDAIGYERLGGMLARPGGWREYFETGPHREPLYPLIIAAAKRLAAGGDHLPILMTMQIGLLALTQVLLAGLLRELGVRARIAVAVLAYFAVSPAVVDAGMSLFSEIVGMPCAVGLTWAVVRIGRRMRSGRRIGPGTAVGLGLLAAVAALGRAVFYYVAYGVAGALILCGLRRPEGRGRLIVFTVAVLCVMELGLLPLRRLNRRFNGSWELTNRYTGLLFGNAARRCVPMTGRLWLAHLAAVPGDGFCRRFFTEEECRATGFHRADDFWHGVLPGLLADTPPERRKARTAALTVRRILSRPFQYTVLSAVEALKMPFWESTRLGFVRRPAGLGRFYERPVVRWGLRAVVSGLTWAALIGLGWRSLKGGAWPPDRRRSVRILIAVLGVYTAAYALFSIVTRYAVVVAPLYLAAVAVWLDDLRRPEEG